MTESFFGKCRIITWHCCENSLLEPLFFSKRMSVNMELYFHTQTHESCLSVSIIKNITHFNHAPNGKLLLYMGERRREREGEENLARKSTSLFLTSGSLFSDLFPMSNISFSKLSWLGSLEHQSEQLNHCFAWSL